MRVAGYDAVRVREYGIEAATDAERSARPTWTNEILRGHTEILASVCHSNDEGKRSPRTALLALGLDLIEHALRYA